MHHEGSAVQAISYITQPTRKNAVRGVLIERGEAVVLVGQDPEISEWAA
jgi:hypothetical protein